MIKTVSVQIEKIKPAFSYFFTGFRADLACLFPFLLQFVFAIQSCFINTYLIMLLLVFSPRCLYLFFHIWRWGWRLGIEFLPLNWKSRHVSNLFPFSYCELMEISFHTLSPIYIWYRDIQKVRPFYMDRSGNFFRQFWLWYFWTATGLNW